MTVSVKDAARCTNRTTEMRASFIGCGCLAKMHDCSVKDTALSKIREQENEGVFHRVRESREEA